MTVDPAGANVLAMASARGGVDIETLAEEHPEQLVRRPIDPRYGMLPFHARALTALLGLAREPARAFAKTARALYQLVRERDATLAEINPLVVTPAGACVAADAKLTVDDNALYRQPFERVPDAFEDAIEYEAAHAGIPFLRFDGDIGVMCAGAGLTNTVLDLIHDFGGRPANFLEFGGPNYRRAREAMTLALKVRPKVLLIVTFGTIARADVMADGIVEAMRKLDPSIPVVTAIRGTNEEQASETLRSAGLEPLRDTEQAVRKAIALAGGEAS
jgi:succinyl-CoA synthetase beta subunit